MYSTGNAIVDAMRNISVTGNVIPSIWYQRIVRENGKPHLLAINLLADIVYWYRPTEIRDEQTGAVKGYKKKFAADLLQRSYADIAEFFGCSKLEATRAVVALEQTGIIKRVFRTITANGVKCSNVLFIELCTEKLASVTSVVDTSQLESREGTVEKLRGVHAKVQTNTKTTTKTTTENTTDIYIAVCAYLNEKAGTNYKYTTPKTQAVIRARLAEGFTIDDFKVVIDKKCAEWVNDSKMSKYLRPETLFGTKFEGYLNAKGRMNNGTSDNGCTATDSAEIARRIGTYI